MSIPSAEDQLKFLAGIQRVLDEGAFVATYKFALLMALADYAVQTGNNGDDPERLTTDDLAESFITYYWRQALPYLSSRDNDGAVLKMSSGNQPVVFTRIMQLHFQHNGSFVALRKSTVQWKLLKKKVSETIARMPLWKLQVVGREVIGVLYHQKAQGYQGKIIDLLPGTLFNLRRHYELIRNLVQNAWLRYVRRLNTSALGEADLDEFLFGSERGTWTGLREILRDIQKDICLYCGKGMRGPGEIDHFIPWARYPLDLGHNFVLAHATCNRSKSDLLAAPQHLANWHERNSLHISTMHEFFDSRGILHNYEATRRIARWAYSQAEANSSLVWYSSKQIVPIDATWKGILI